MYKMSVAFRADFQQRRSVPEVRSSSVQRVPKSECYILALYFVRENQVKFPFIINLIGNE